MSYMERIEVNPAVLVGKPVIRGTRLAVHFIVGLLASGWAEEEVLENYPGITHEDILACLTYAAAVLETENSWRRSSPGWSMGACKLIPF